MVIVASTVELLGLLGLLFEHMLLICSVDVDIIRLFALVRLLRFITLMLVNLFRRWLLELPCGSTTWMVRTSANIAATSILAGSILEVCLAARGIQTIVSDNALVWNYGIELTLLVFRWIVALLRAELCHLVLLLLQRHWVLFDVQGRYL